MSKIDIPFKPKMRAVVQSANRSDMFTTEGKIVGEYFRHPQTGTLEKKIMVEVTKEGWNREK